MMLIKTVLACAFATVATGFVLPSSKPITSTRLYAEETKNLVTPVTGEMLEVMMQDWEQPIVIDAYATVSKHPPL